MSPVLRKGGTRREHVADQEVVRLERMLANRKARVADAERKLAAAKERAKEAKR